MTARQASFAATNATASQIQGWATWLSQGILAAGWVQSADTGQCSTSTLSVPGAVNTSMGYQIFQMADTLQSTAPVFLKLEYGSGAAVNNPSIWITLGTGSDGAGGLTGIKLTRTQIAATSATSTALNSCLSGDTNRLTLCLWFSSLSYMVCVIIERTHAASGSDNSDGLLVLWAAGGLKWSQYLPFSGVIPATYANWNVTTPPTGSGALSPNMYFYPVRCWSPGETIPMFGVLGYVSGDAATGGTYLVQCYDGTSRTYMMLGANFPTIGFGNSNTFAGVRFD